MKKTRRKPNRSFKTAKKPRTRRRRLRLISRVEARRQAERHVLKRMFRGATVRDGAEVRLGIYARGN